MKKMIVLAMHGAPPTDFPTRELLEFFGLHARLEHGAGPVGETLRQRHDELESKIRSWPRTEENDPFYAGSQALANALEREMGLEVLLGFNEFCAPSLDQALDEAVARGAEKVMVVTPMMTRGGEHSEEEIPEVIEQGRDRHPGTQFVYVWPFDLPALAQFLSGQIERFR
jgi:sirohydrochlorin cobaltochelatase